MRILTISLAERICEVEQKIQLYGVEDSLVDFFIKREKPITQKEAINKKIKYGDENCIFGDLQKGALCFDQIKNSEILVDDSIINALFAFLDFWSLELLIQKILKFQEQLRKAGKPWDKTKKSVTQQIKQIAIQKELYQIIEKEIKLTEQAFESVKTGKRINLSEKICLRILECINELDINSITFDKKAENKNAYQELIDTFGSDNSELENKLDYINSVCKIKLSEASIQVRKKDQSDRTFFRNISSNYLDKGVPTEIYNFNNKIELKGLTSVAHCFCKPIAIVSKKATGDDNFLRHITDVKDLKNIWPDSKINLPTTYLDLTEETRTLVALPLLFLKKYAEYEIEISMGFVSFEFEKRIDYIDNNLKDAFITVAEMISQSILTDK